MKRITIAALAVMLMSGCATIPFEPMPDSRPGQLTATEVLEAFDAVRPRRYEALQSVVFQMYWRKMGGIGSLAVDLDEGSFALAGMTHAGMKLFEVQGDEHAVEADFAMASFGESADLAAAVGADVRRIYFDTLPPGDAEVLRKKYKITYIHRSPDGRTEYDFAGPRQLLSEKRIYAERKMLCRIRYGDYREHDGFLHPHAVLLQNRTHNYSLMLHLKSVYSSEDLRGGETGPRQPGASNRMPRI